MRRLGLVLLLAGAAVAVSAGPAAAHVCTISPVIPVGELRTIQVAVTVEQATVPDVEITMPAGLRLDRVDTKAGWTFTRSGATVRFRGGPIQEFTCEYFSMGVTATTMGAYGIPVIQRDAAGTVVARSIPDPADLQPLLEQVVYAGVQPPAPPSSGGGSSNLLVIAAVAGGIVLLAVIGTLAWRNNRRGDGYDDEDEDDETETDDERDAELAARLAEFKKQTPRREPD